MPVVVAAVVAVISSGPGDGDGPQVRFENDEVRVELQLACVGGRLTGAEQIDD